MDIEKAVVAHSRRLTFPVPAIKPESGIKAPQQGRKFFEKKFGTYLPLVSEISGWKFLLATSHCIDTAEASENNAPGHSSS